jgi:pSer/pThr/pTyr-binding forkhead associated (FHA) protein
MSELTLLLIKIGFLALLWVFVLSAISVIRTDLFGERAPTPVGPKPGRIPKQPKPARKRRGDPSQLVVVEGPNAGVAVTLEELPILIGRGADATIRLDDDYVSTRHARFVPQGTDWYVEDLGSTNGTYIGSQRLSSPILVNLGVPVRIGKTIVELRK